MQIIKSATVIVLVTMILLATSHSDSLISFVSSANAASVEKRSAVIVKMELSVEQADFNLADRNHFLRKQRIDFYLEQARYFDEHEWYYNRDEALERASNILSHHKRM